MFGEKSIIGLRTITVDEKGRIVLPKFTFAEENEEIVFYELNKHSFSIASLNFLKQKMIEFKEVGFDTIPAINVHEVKKQIEDIYATIVGVATVDKKRKVLIPKLICDEYLPFDYHTKGNLIAEGHDKKLKLFYTSEEFIQKQKEI